MEIMLKNGLVAKCDEDLHSFFCSLKWYLLNGRGKIYARHNLYFPNEKKKLYDVFMHHMVIGRPIKKGMVVDHINGDTLDNQKSNLRIVSHRENCSNTSRRREGKKTSQYTGVSWNTKAKKWISVIQINGHLNYLGRFDSEEQARDAYNKTKEAL